MAQGCLRNGEDQNFTTVEEILWKVTRAICIEENSLQIGNSIHLIPHALYYLLIMYTMRTVILADESSRLHSVELDMNRHL